MIKCCNPIATSVIESGAASGELRVVFGGRSVVADIQLLLYQLI